jgi:hypothetical protein
MSILGNIFSRIMNRGRPAQTSAPQPTPRPTTATSPTQQTSAAPQSAAVTRLDDLDVAKLLDEMGGKQQQKLDWRRSIVDLMKLLGMDSTLAERRELAQELGYKGDTKDTAAMNIWLHQQVLRKLADNGGKVPQDLLH